MKYIVLKPYTLTPRGLAKIARTIVSFQRSLGNICSLMTNKEFYILWMLIILIIKG